MPYPDTTRMVWVGIEAVEGVPAAVLFPVHTTNEPAHTLQNGIVIPQENTDTRMRDNGTARGKRSSTLRIQAYVRADELPFWAKMGIGAQVTTPGSATGTHVHTFKAGVIRPQPATVVFFNGLYYRQMTGCRVNTLNIQGFGNQLAMLDVEVIGRASAPITPGTLPALDETYKPMDIPTQTVNIGGTLDPDMDRMSVQVANNLAQRSTMDGTASTGRTRMGFVDVTVDGMVDYPAYAGSLYEAFENATQIGALALRMVDDRQEIGTGTPIHPSVITTVPIPILADTSEGSDGGELVQMVKGRGEYSGTDAAGCLVVVTNDKPATTYDPS